MSVSGVDSHHPLQSHELPSRQQRQHRVGEEVRMVVLQRMDEVRYQVGFADGWRIVSSTVALPVGATIRAVVTAVGDTLELQYQGSDPVASAMAQHEAGSEDSLAEYEQRFKLSMSQTDRVSLQDAMRTADDSDTMRTSGLFLAKLSAAMDAPKLQAVYDSQRWREAVAGTTSGGGSKSAVDIDGLAKAMEGALREAPANVIAAARNLAPDDASGSSSDDDAERERRQIAWELLNQQDGGSVEYRYGVLPLIVADQLFELDLVYFRDRQSSADAAARSKRMVMTLNAPTLGHVEVVAQAIGERVSVTIRSDSEASRQILSVEHARVRELLERLGWGVDAIRYETGDIDRRAAAHVVDHVLKGNSLSSWV